jgi:hypothetical protein
MNCTEWTENRASGVIALRIAEERAREIARIAERTTADLEGAKGALSGYAITPEIKALVTRATELMFIAHKLAADIQSTSGEVEA